LLHLRDELCRYLEGAGIAAGPLTPVTAIYYDAEYLDQGADVEVVVPLARRLREQGRVAVHKLPGIETAASLVHHGSHSQLPGAYQALITWAQANGYQTGFQIRTVYLQGWEAHGSPESCITELQLPIVPMSCITTFQRKEIETMEPKIVEKAAFTVVGLPFTGFISHQPFANGSGNNEIGLVWDQLNARMGEIAQINGPAYGVCFGQPNDKEPWYLAGFEVAQATNIPSGMTSMTVPAQKYAVFPCTMETLGETYRYIVQEWQPSSGYEHADAPDFEYYDEEPDGDPKQMRLSVYWPVK
jgi:predicted transcriptional regulator YdeE/effector-binding domain-containing protein